MECVHPFVEKIMNWCVVYFYFYFLNVDEYSYSLIFLLYVNILNLKLLASRSISLLIIFSHPFISFFWCILILMIVNYPIHHHSHLKY